MIDFTLEEAAALREAIETPGPLLSGLIKFMEAKNAEMNAYCADAMRDIPRRFEHAADYSAQAGVYARLLGELRTEAKKA